MNALNGTIEGAALSGDPSTTRAPVAVEARHPHWSSTILLEPESGRARLLLNGATGSYTIADDVLRVAWDAFAPDHFVLRQGQFVHVELLGDGNADRSTVLAEVPGSAYVANLRLKGDDMAIYRRVFIDKVYDSAALPERASVIVDLGAHIGLASLFLAARYPDATIIALEPNKAHYGLLRQNLARVGPRAVALQAALWSEDRLLHMGSGEHLGSGEVDPSGGGEATIVDGWSMARLMRECRLERVHILKIDIDGSEKALFQGDTSWLDHVDTLVIRSRLGARADGTVLAPRLPRRGLRLRERAEDIFVFSRANPAPDDDVALAAPPTIASLSKTLKVAVTNFWSGFSIESGFFKHLLDLAFESWSLEERASEADVVLTSVFPHAPAADPRKTIAVIWENIRPNYRLYGYSLSSDPDHYGHRNFRLPLWLTEIAWSADRVRWSKSGAICHGHEPLLDLATLTRPRTGLVKRPKFCAFVAANPEPHRIMAAEALSRVAPVEAYGPITGRIETRSKYEILADHAFSMCFENSLFPGYHTEKLPQAWAAGGIPLYFGDLSVERDFNPSAFLNRCAFPSLDAFVAEVAAVRADPERYERMWSQPLLLGEPSLAPAVDFLRATLRAIQA
jgi:FkbM family methyltransferase